MLKCNKKTFPGEKVYFIFLFRFWPSLNFAVKKMKLFKYLLSKYENDSQRET